MFSLFLTSTKRNETQYGIYPSIHLRQAYVQSFAYINPHFYPSKCVLNLWPYEWVIKQYISIYTHIINTVMLTDVTVVAHYTGESIMLLYTNAYAKCPYDAMHRNCRPKLFTNFKKHIDSIDTHAPQFNTKDGILESSAKKRHSIIQSTEVIRIRMLC